MSRYVVFQTFLRCSLYNKYVIKLFNMFIFMIYMIRKN